MVRVKSLVEGLRSYKLQGVAKKNWFFFFIWREHHSFWNCMWPLEPFWLPFTLAASLVFLWKAAASQCELSLFSSWCDPPRFSASFWCTSDGYLEFRRSGSDSHLLQASQLPSDHPGIWFCKIPLQWDIPGRDTVWFEVSPAICTSTIEMPFSSFCRIHFLWPWKNQERDSFPAALWLGTKVYTCLFSRDGYESIGQLSLSWPKVSSNFNKNLLKDELEVPSWYGTSPFSHWFSVTIAWKHMTPMWELAGWSLEWIKGCWGCVWEKNASSPFLLFWPMEKMETVSPSHSSSYSHLSISFAVVGLTYCVKPTRTCGLDLQCPIG